MTAAELAAMLPSLSDMLSKYHLEVDAAFHLLRPTIPFQIETKRKALGLDVCTKRSASEHSHCSGQGSRLLYAVHQAGFKTADGGCKGHVRRIGAAITIEPPSHAYSGMERPHTPAGRIVLVPFPLRPASSREVIQRSYFITSTAGGTSVSAGSLIDGLYL